MPAFESALSKVDEEATSALISDYCDGDSIVQEPIVTPLNGPDCLSLVNEQIGFEGKLDDKELCDQRNATACGKSTNDAERLKEEFPVDVAKTGTNEESFAFTANANNRSNLSSLADAATIRIETNDDLQGKTADSEVVEKTVPFSTFESNLARLVAESEIPMSNVESQKSANEDFAVESMVQRERETYGIDCESNSCAVQMDQSSASDSPQTEQMVDTSDASRSDAKTDVSRLENEASDIVCDGLNESGDTPLENSLTDEQIELLKDEIMSHNIDNCQEKNRKSHALDFYGTYESAIDDALRNGEKYVQLSKDREQIANLYYSRDSSALVIQPKNGPPTCYGVNAVDIDKVLEYKRCRKSIS
jgi:hypothetical protein